jgi:hypothetical protein
LFGVPSSSKDSLNSFLVWLLARWIPGAAAKKRMKKGWDGNKTVTRICDGLSRQQQQTNKNSDSGDRRLL